VTRDAALPRVSPGAAPLKLADGPAARETYAWQPDRSPSGPVSIVVSLADGRIVILRNGIEIGSSAFSLEGEVAGTEAYSLASVDAAGKMNWVRLPLPGQANDARSRERRRFSAPDGFRKAVAPLLVPGTTVLLTPDSLRRGGTGTRLDLLQSESLRN
jgi:hypothetical protein